MEWKTIGGIIVLLIMEVFTLKLGLIDGSAAMLNVCQKAIADAKTAGRCIKEDVHVLNVIACDSERPAVGTTNAVSLFYSDNIDAYVAPLCADELEELARLAYFYNRPVLNRAIPSDALMHITDFPHVVEFSPISISQVGVALSEIAKLLKIDNVALVGPSPDNEDVSSLISALSEYFKLNKLLTVNGVVMIPNWNVTFEKLILLRMPQSKLIAITDDWTNSEATMRKLSVQELTKSGHTVVFICRQTIDRCMPDMAAMDEMKILVLVPQPFNVTARVNAMTAIVGEGFDVNLMEQYVSSYSACYGFCFASQRNRNDGKTYSQTFSSAKYDTPIGSVSFDGGHGIMQQLVLYTVDTKTKSYIPLLSLIPSSKTCSNATCFTLTPQTDQQSFWDKRANQTVDYSLVTTVKQNDIIIYIIIGSCIIVIIVVAIGVYIYQRKRNNIFHMTWRVTKDALKIIEAPKSSKKANQEALVNKRRSNVSYALLGSMKAEYIYLKQTRKTNFSRDEIMFLMNLKKISHDNLATFMGVNFNDVIGKFYLLNVLVERASLQDFIADEDFQMDNTFTSAFVRDITRGLLYLHKSPVGYHGLLNTTTCLIDANWVLKLTHFGVSNMINKLQGEGVLEAEIPLDITIYHSTAPENLLTCEFPRQYPCGSSEGDIYAFGMILYVMIFNREPFANTGGQRELLEQIIHKGLRPPIDVDSEVKELLDRCWTREPGRRASLKEIQTFSTKIFSTAQGNLIDQMIRMNERYAHNLEHIVTQRTALLRELQATTEKLLKEMLPATIAEKLMTKQVIEPRSYSAATVLFCQLVDFSVLLTKSNAEQIISFLNDVFTSFDEIIKTRDAYKVETTGETYMVASGVPEENEGRDVFVIADIALSLRERSYAYRVAYLPDYKVRVRIGFHCGPIAAGVIGIKSPRYCLFGDTVNFASRMQSNCPPDQIQTSEITARKLMVNDEYELVQRGIVKVKGKGDVNCYWLNEHIHGEHGFVDKLIVVGQKRPPTRGINSKDPPLRPSAVKDLEELDEEEEEEEEKEENQIMEELMEGEQMMKNNKIVPMASLHALPRSRSQRRSSRVEEEKSPGEGTSNQEDPRRRLSEGKKEKDTKKTQ